MMKLLEKQLRASPAVREGIPEEARFCGVDPFGSYLKYIFERISFPPETAGIRISEFWTVFTEGSFPITTVYEKYESPVLS